MLVHANSIKIPLADNSVHCVVTSPPYYNLRDYNIPGQIGLEPTIAAYIAVMVQVFREVWRVLRLDGVCWVNLGDTYATSRNGRSAADTKKAGKDDRTFRDKPFSTGGVGSNFLNSLKGVIEGGSMFIANRCTATITPKSHAVLKFNHLSPDSELPSLLGVQGVFIKQGDNNLAQVFQLLDSKSNIRISPMMTFVRVNNADLEIILNEGDDISIVITDYDLDTQPALHIPISALPTKDTNVPLAIKEATKPIAKTVANLESVGDSFALNSSGESGLNINLINQMVAGSDALVFSPNGLRDFGVRKASLQHLSLSLLEGRVDFTVNCVGHLFVSNNFGSLTRYVELYDKAKRLSNATRSKQELGIPEMVKRALMEDGWICRSTIIWSKTNPMPESVTDRPSKSHEYIFMLVKSERYYYDAEAIKEQATTINSRPDHILRNIQGDNSTTQRNDRGFPGNPDRQKAIGFHKQSDPTSRNRRSVWEIATEPYPAAHYATFPRKLVEPMIKAGTSAKGVCRTCGAPWQRVTERRKAEITKPRHFSKAGNNDRNDTLRVYEEHDRVTAGWQPTCKCPDNTPIPAVVLDCFCGSGTVGYVANELGRRFIGIDLSAEYLAKNALPRAEKKMSQSALNQLPLFKTAA